MRILFKVSDQPIGSFESLLPGRIVSRLAEDVVVCETPLGDRDWVVLQADDSAIVEHGDAGRVVVAGVVRLLAKLHVVLA